MDQNKELRTEKLDLITHLGYKNLISSYGGNIGNWKKACRENWESKVAREDYQFVLQLEKKLKEDPNLLNRIKKMVEREEKEEKEFREENNI
ncbi:hypothetical protein ES705_21342 [subsurface metagenome]